MTASKRQRPFDNIHLSPLSLNFGEDGREAQLNVFSLALKWFGNHSGTISGVKRTRQRLMTGPEAEPNRSPWWRKYVLHGIEIERSETLARQFRCRFRMSYPRFVAFVEYLSQNSWFGRFGRPDALGKPGAPVELLVLGALAVLGGSITHLYLPDMTNISSETHRRFFHHFISIGQNKLYPLWIRAPETAEEIAKAMRGYTLAGRDGAIASCDATRIRLWNCANNLRQKSIGKEKFPARTFQLCVNYTTEIFSSTRGYDGSESDHTIAKEDPFLNAIHFKRRYQDVEWTRVNADGTTTIEKGVWIIVDGGYPGWESLICPLGVTSNPDDIIFSHWLVLSTKPMGKMPADNLPKEERRKQLRRLRDLQNGKLVEEKTRLKKIEEILTTKTALRAELTQMDAVLDQTINRL